jgi:alpha-aminoadipate carrier protein LysW
MNTPIECQPTSTEVESPRCPECQAAVVLPGEVIVTEIVDCDGCAAELEVIGLAPVLLALAPEVEEDWGE